MSKPLKILIAPDSFKESLSAAQVCQIISEAFVDKIGANKLEITSIPLSDGGEGLIEILKNSLLNHKIVIKRTVARDAFAQNIKVEYLIIDNKIAILEMASVAGLHLLKDSQKNPMQTSTQGVGDLIKHALDNNIRDFIIGIGGTSTNDIGFGMLQVLGVEFFDKNNNLITKSTPNDFKFLSKIDTSKIDPRLKDVKFTIACDVDNVLCGYNGASCVFAPQKGANLMMTKELDDILLNFSKIANNHLHSNMQNNKGSGAAGGIGFTFLSFFNATLEPGINIIMEMNNFTKHIKNADIIITGEGKTDSQTLNGKVVFGVGQIAKNYNKKVIVISGCLESGYELLYNHGITAIFSTSYQIDTLDNILKKAEHNLRCVAYAIAGLIL